ncbi:MAG TPA: DUF4386 domain-containing protein [Thermoanaerobaculia bacterium]|nr:DUF4386 domain-containing protein [Thermoanaerobaculia bacterium]
MKTLPDVDVGRATGLLYLIVVVSGIFSLAYVPSQLIVPGDGAATFRRIEASENLFRLGIAAGFVCYTAFLLLPLAFYKLLAHVDRRAALLMVLFAVASVPLSLGNLVNKLDVATLISGRSYLRGYSPEQLHAAVMLSLARYNSGVLVAEIFWGLWLLPLGYLVFRSRILPRTLGVFLVLGCFGYLIDVFGRTAVPGYATTTLASLATLPASIGEIGTCLWLLLFGARKTAGGEANDAFERTAGSELDPN